MQVEIVRLCRQGRAVNALCARHPIYDDGDIRTYSKVTYEYCICYLFFSSIIRTNVYIGVVPTQCTKLDGGGGPAGRSPDLEKNHV